MQAMTKRMNFMMGNVCDRLDRVERCGNEVETSTQDVRKVGAEPKANNGSRADRPRWDDYEDFEEDVDDIDDGGFGDETISQWKGFWQPRNQRDFGYKKVGVDSAKGKLCVVLGDMMIDIERQKRWKMIQIQ
jgi:hypothetical protein